MTNAKQYEKTITALLRRSSRPRTTVEILAELARAHGDPQLDDADLEALLASYPGLERTPHGWRPTARPEPPREEPESELDLALANLLEKQKGPLGVAVIFKHLQRVAPCYTRKEVLTALHHPRIAHPAPGRYQLHPAERERRARLREQQEGRDPLSERAHAALRADGVPRTSRALAQRCGATTGKLHAALAADPRFVFDEHAQRWRLAAWDGALRALLAPGSAEDLERTAQLHALLREHPDTTLSTLATLSGIPAAPLLELVRSQAAVFALTERHRVGGGKQVSFGVGLTAAARAAHPIAPPPARDDADPERALRHELRRAHPGREAQEAPAPLSAREVLAKLLASDEPN